MSKEGQKTITEIKEGSKRLAEQAGELVKKASPLGDKNLVEKIQKIQEGSREVVRHIEERTEK